MNVVQLLKRRMLLSRRLLVILFVFVFAVLAVRAVFDVWMGLRLNDEIAQLEKQYGPLAWDPVRKLDAWRTWPRRIAPNNRARMMDAAAARITLSDANADLLYPPHAPSTMTADQVREIADDNRDAVQLAIRAARLQHSNWDIVYLAEPSNVPNLMDLNYLSNVLAVAARSDTDAGRADEAVADVTAGFAEAAAMRSEPAPIMALHAMRVAARQVEALKDILCRSDPSGPALAGLAAAIDENLIGSPMREALLGELKHGRFIWPWVERGNFDGRRAGETPTAWTRGVAWFFRPVIRFLAMRDLAYKARAVEAASMLRSRRAGVSLPPSAGTSGWLQVGPSPSAFGLIETGDRSTAIVGLAATAVALRRFKLDHGAYPNALDELAPSYLKAMPLDPFTERQPEYKRQGAGFELRAQIPPPGIPRGVKDEKIATSYPGEWKIPR
jgi:hypothetical protein